jgi:4-hydroxybenzoyl-CoA reductase gamma subunit
MQYMPSRKVGQGTVARAIERQSETRPDQAAVVCTGYAPLSYRELQNLINQMRAELRAAGFGANARIAIALPSGPHAALAIVAIACSAVAVPLNPKHTLDEIEKSFATLRPEAVLLLRGSDSAARRAAERKGLAIVEAIPASEGTLGLKVVAPQAITAAPPDEPDPEAPAFILQTSGTAAEPKSIPFSHRNMLAAAARLEAWFKLTPQDCCLSVSPVYYSHGLKVTVFTPLLTGGTVAFPADPSQFDYSEWFGTLRPTWYSAGPTLHRLIFDKTESIADAKTKHSLRFVLSGGAPLPRNILEGLQCALDVPVVEHYGSSEAAQIAANLPSPGRSKVGTCGIPWPGTVMIVDEDGRRLPAGEQGEILIGGPTLISGYLDAPELNRACFVDGWFKTGDIGSLDNDGFLILHGRLKDLINRGGEKVSPPEIDATLMRHPAVAEAAAFAVPHERLGEDVAAAVVLKPGVAASPLELRAYLSDRLAAFKVPRRIVIVDQLPKGLTGKVLRRRLSESFGTTMGPAAAATRSNDVDLSSQLIGVWERLLKTTSITIDDDFFDKGADSLLAAELLIEVERLIGRKVPSSLLFEATTIRQLMQTLSEEENIQAKALFQMSSNGKQRPFIYFHGDGGGGRYVMKLASLLGSDLSMFVVAPHGLDNTPVPSSIEAMAADRLPLIMEAQPKGPYRLGGYCIGGLVAFEVARLLIAAGEKVEMVAMIDAPTANARPSIRALLSFLNLVQPFGGSVVEFIIARTWFRLQLVIARLESFLKRRPSEWWPKIKAKTRTFVVDCMYRLGVTDQAGDPNRVWIALNDFPRAYAIPGSRYLPKPLSVRIIYFSAAYSWQPWRRISSDIQAIKLSSDHYSVVRDPTELANHLRVLLQEKPREKILLQPRAAGILRLILNGRVRADAVPDNVLLLDYLRESVGLTGTKIGCDGGECGACTVLVDDQPRLSCLTLASMVDGRRVDTIESLTRNGHLSAVQRGFHEKLGSQCGYCTPGFIMASAGLLRRNKRPSEEEIRDALGSNICRCTGYVKIIEAVQHAADLHAAGVAP